MPSDEILRRHGFIAMGSVFSTWRSPRDARELPRGARSLKLRPGGALGASNMDPKMSLENFVMRSQVFEAAKWHLGSLFCPE